MAFGCGFSIPAFYGAASGLGMFASASLYLDFTSGNQTLDSRITFTRASAATRTNRAGLIETVSTDQPRFDYDPVTLQPKGLLIEEQRTNLLTYSEQFDNAFWAKNEATITANQAVAPDGTTTADLFTTSAATGVEHYILETWTAAATTTYTGSVYAKAGTGNFISIQFRVASVWPNSINPTVDFNLTTGTASNSTGNPLPTYSITNVGNGWYRCTITATTNATGGTPQFRVQTQDGAGTVYIWGAQLETGTSATSYIPTTTAQATRAADAATMTGTNFSSWWNATEGSIYAEFDTYDDTAASRTSVHLDDTTVSNRIMFNRVASRVGMMTVTVAGVNQVDMANGPVIPYGAVGKVAGAYKTNDFAVSSAGTTVSVDTLGTLPSVTQMGIGCRFGASNFINGHIKRIAYFPKRLSNTELQALTS